MTIQQLEQRLDYLERQVALMQHQMRRPLSPLAKIEDTFGMFANDPEFDEIVRLGRDYRDQTNAEGR